VVSFKGLKIDKEEMEDENELKAQRFVWYLYVDMYCLNDDGNVTDACIIALLSALNNGTRVIVVLNIKVELPQVIITTDGNVFTVPDAPKRKLLLSHFPVPVTFGTIDE
jgi:exosome complex component RRP43